MNMLAWASWSFDPSPDISYHSFQVAKDLRMVMMRSASYVRCASSFQGKSIGVSSLYQVFVSISSGNKARCVSELVIVSNEAW